MFDFIREGQTAKTQQEQTPHQSTNDPASQGDQSTTSVDPLDKFNEILYPKQNGDPDPGDSSDSATPDEPLDPTKVFDNPEAVSKILSSIDFSKSISPETQSLLENNDPKGFTSAMADTARTAVLEALKMSSVLTKQTIEDTVQRVLKESKGQISRSLEDAELRREMPQLDNPVIRLGMEAVKEQLRKQNPSMSPAQLATQLKEYWEAANKHINPSELPSTTASAADDLSWEDWASN